MFKPVSGTLMFLIFVAAVSHSSCKNVTQKTDAAPEKDTTQVADTATAFRLNPEIEKFITLFPEEELPFKADETLLEKVTKGKILNGEQVQLLAASWAKGKESALVNFTLESFYKIDSLKTAGGYDAYLESLDIGMTKDNNAYAISRIKFDSENEILIWGIETSSYEACPYFHEADIFMTILYKGQIGESYLLAQDYSEGDPPVAMSRKIVGMVNAPNDITTELYEVNDEDMEMPTIEVTETKSTITVEGDKLIVKAKEKAPYRKKRPESEE